MDPRVARTRRSLQLALLELARERPFESITVGDIAERAGVNRSSFYQHFSDKEVLLADALDAIIEEAGSHVPVAPDTLDAPPAALFGYLEHVDANAALYRMALGEHGSATVMKRLRERIGILVRERVDATGPGTPFEGLPVDIVAAGIAGSALGVIRAWLDRDPRPSPRTAAAWVWQMMLGADATRGSDTVTA
ncbi:TetR/AcrR family transcriptional regulator [Microbacterium sp. No. 7]|uniref:TetR/AcrR family transcriptional regulator n=1 Tax=Microbacterium sp. No. 7 TaxID=1714373 RepID=UPI0006D0D6E1|nr:TetR/AcrR family transcriptional regulator [Microbacterium sp. No. 7]ALJ18675.1 TetR family transcriptional regulator [Microbacterium sp. No. 7]